MIDWLQYTFNLKQFYVLLAAVVLWFRRVFDASPLGMVRGPASLSYLLGHWSALTKEKDGNNFMMNLT
jgi:hypothetical protein